MSVAGCKGEKEQQRLLSGAKEKCCQPGSPWRQPQARRRGVNKLTEILAKTKGFPVRRTPEKCMILRGKRDRCKKAGWSGHNVQQNRCRLKKSAPQDGKHIGEVENSYLDKTKEGG